MQNTPWAEREIFEALRVIAAETETDLGEIIDALTGYAWGEEEREDLRKMIPDILADIEDVPKPTPEPPKPTGEQLKHYICKGCKDARVNNTACLNWDRCQLGESFGNGMYKYLRRLWTPKPAEQPAQMICDHAGECKGDFYCADRVPHTKCSDCSDPSCSQFSHRICVPWVEPVKESKELPDGMFSERNPNGQTYCERLWCEFRMQKEKAKESEKVIHASCEGCAYEGINFFMCGGCFNHTETMSNQVRRNWTPKQPEPAAPDVKENFTAKEGEAIRDFVTALFSFTEMPKEPKAAPGLV